jgi:hypothetical protein
MNSYKKKIHPKYYLAYCEMEKLRSNHYLSFSKFISYLKSLEIK